MKENNENNKPAAASAAGTGAPCERAVLVAVVRDNQDPRQAEEFLDELEFLAETADIRAVRRFTQRLPQPSARIYVGPGKLQEIADFCREEEIDVVIFDDELTPSQTRNIEKEMPCRLLVHRAVQQHHHQKAKGQTVKQRLEPTPLRGLRP